MEAPDRLGGPQIAVKAGQILYSANGFIIDRIQAGGVTAMNVPTTNIQEVGNFKIVDVVRDIPDLTFEIQSTDVSTDIEAIQIGLDPSTVVAGPGGGETALDFYNSVPVDVISPFRSGQFKFNAVQGIVVPYLTLETVAYKYGLKANAEETFTMRGDAIYYCPGIPYRDTHAGGTTSFAFANGPALLYHEASDPVYALGVCWYDSTTGLYKRLFHGANFDYTDTNTTVTLNAGVTIPATATVSIVYCSATPATYPANSLSPVSVKPGAIRSRDIDVYVAPQGATPVFQRLTGVQSFDLTRKVTLQNDEEFGNRHYVSQDYNTADVTGTIGLKGVDPYDVVAKAQLLAGVPSSEVSGPNTSPPIQMEVRLSHPATRVVLKTIYVPDATFTASPAQGRVGQKLESSFKWDSLQGNVTVFKGSR